MKEKNLDSLLKGIKGKKKTDLDKFMLVYAKLAHRVSYDLNCIGQEENQDMLILENELEKGKTNSAGYSELLNKCLERVDIESKSIHGKLDDSKHSYNQVKLDGKWYNTDLSIDRENILEGRSLKYTLKSDKEFEIFDAVSMEKEKCSDSISDEKLSEYEYILKYETNNLFEIIENIENNSNDSTVITYNADLEEMLLVNEKGINDVPTTKEQFFNIMDDKENKQNIFVLNDIKEEYEKERASSNLPVPYKQNKVLDFFDTLRTKFVEKFFNKAVKREQIEEKSATSLFTDLKHQGKSDINNENSLDNKKSKKIVKEEVR